MEAIRTTVEEMIDHAGDLAESYYQLTVVKATDQAGKTAASALMTLLVGGFAGLVLVFAGLGLAWWLGDLLENRKAGFFLVAGIYLLALGLVILLKKSVIIPMVRNAIIRNVYGK